MSAACQRPGDDMAAACRRAADERSTATRPSPNWPAHKRNPPISRTRPPGQDLRNVTGVTAQTADPGELVLPQHFANLICAISLHAGVAPLRATPTFRMTPRRPLETRLTLPAQTPLASHPAHPNAPRPPAPGRPRHPRTHEIALNPAEFSANRVMRVMQVTRAVRHVLAVPLASNRSGGPRKTPDYAVISLYCL